ncbi:MAG: CTP synthase, partial [Candidatus Diapherotrites archaeon]|nr:CTP synthase [Candidatus Diapherotrites archaeon]
MNGEELVKNAAKQETSTEFYSPIPKGYEKGKTKFLIVAGSVMSGIGKGIFSSSLAMLLKYYGLKIQPIKFDGYLNLDAGTLNPYRHGEVFVLEDGLECDMDMGSYERFLDQNVNKNNYMTAGMVFDTILKRERNGEYLGRDVQFIPHVTGEIKFRLRNLALKTQPDIVVLEVGGTVGDIENSYLIEAIRELIHEEGKENVCFVNLVYIIEPPNLGEQKSKAAQMGLNKLMSLGIQTDIVVCRAVNPVEERIKDKISVYSNVPVENVLSLHNARSVFEAPLVLKEQNTDKIVVKLLGLQDKVDEKKQLQ